MNIKVRAHNVNDSFFYFKHFVVCLLSSESGDDDGIACLLGLHVRAGHFRFLFHMNECREVSHTSDVRW